VECRLEYWTPHSVQPPVNPQRAAAMSATQTDWCDHSHSSGLLLILIENADI
jgi:hypothetical protein